MSQRRGLTALSVAGVRLTARGWWFLGGSAVAFIGAYAGGRSLLLPIACLLLALPVIAVLYVAVRRPRLSVHREFSPGVIAAGATTRVSLLASNRTGGTSARASWWDAVPWHPWSTPASRLPALQPRGARFARGNATVLSYDLAPPRRGLAAIGPLTVEVQDAFGLAASSAVVGTAQELVVTPEVVALAETGLSIPAGDGESRLVQRRATGDDDDAMTREYRDGDAMRRVHWRASARHGDLMVRQEEQRSFPEARIVIDTTTGGYRDVDDDSDSAAFEWVVRMLASVAVHLRRVGFLVTVEESAAAQLDAVGRGKRRTWGDEEFLTSLASLHLRTAPALRPSDRGSNGPVIAIVGNPTPDTVEWMLAHRRPGELAVAFLVRRPTSIDLIDRTFGVPPGAGQLDEKLADSGWLVVPVRSDDDHAAAWEAVVAELGRSRGSV